MSNNRSTLFSLFLWMLLLCQGLLGFESVAFAASANPNAPELNIPELPQNVPVTGILGNTRSCANVAGQIDFENCIDDSDLSKHYLGMIFGDVGTVLQGESLGIGNDLMARLFKIFNVVILTLGSMVVMYTTLISTINTAQEGELMGQKWSSVWIPLRSVAGVSLLLPIGKGYSLIQIFIMWIILQGVGAANAVWGVVLDYVSQGNSINQPSNITPEGITGLNEAIQSMFKSMVCAKVINDNPDYVNSLGGNVEVYVSGDGFNVGVPGGTNDTADVCGGVTVPTSPTPLESNQDDGSDVDMTGQLMSTLRNIYVYLSIIANDAVDLDPSLWDTKGIVYVGATNYANGLQEIADQAASHSSQDKQEMLDSAKTDGWITAGSYYYKLIRSEPLNNPIFQLPPNTSAPNTGHPWNDTVRTKTQAYIDQMGIGGPNRGSINLGPSQLGDSSQLYFGAFTTFATKFMDHMSNNDSDPLVSLQKFGSDIIMTVEILWIVGLVGVIALLAVSWFSGPPGASPAGHFISSVIETVIFVVNLVLVFLWSVGVALGIYLPLVPYIVFSLSALSWITLVLETIVAAPIVALGLTAPSNDHMGQAKPALLLLAGVFLRPSLMIIGFVAASRVYLAIMQLIKYSFAGVVHSQLTGIGLFGSIALIVIYGGIAISIAHECFTLIYEIPDKTLRWIGGSPEQSSVAKNEQEIRRGSEQGAQASMGVAQGSAQQIQKWRGDIMKNKGQGQGGVSDDDGGSSPPAPSGGNTPAGSPGGGNPGGNPGGSPGSGQMSGGQKGMAKKAAGMAISAKTGGAVPTEVGESIASKGMDQGGK